MNDNKNEKKGFNELLGKYENILSLFEILVGFLFAFATLCVAISANNISKNQAEIMKIQLEYQKSDYNVSFSVQKEESYNMSIGDGHDTSVIPYKVVKSGGNIKDTFLVPTTLIDIKYDNEYICRVNLDYYTKDRYEFDYEKNEFTVEKLEITYSVEDVWNDLVQWVYIASIGNGSFVRPELNDYFESDKLSYTEKECFRIYYKDSLNNEYTEFYLIDGENMRKLQDTTSSNYSYELTISPPIKDIDKEFELTIGSYEDYETTYQKVGNQLEDILSTYLINKKNSLE